MYTPVRTVIYRDLSLVYLFDRFCFWFDALSKLILRPPADHNWTAHCRDNIVMASDIPDPSAADLFAFSSTENIGSTGILNNFIGKFSKNCQKKKQKSMKTLTPRHGSELYMTEWDWSYCQG